MTRSRQALQEMQQGGTSIRKHYPKLSVCAEPSMPSLWKAEYPKKRSVFIKETISCRKITRKTQRVNSMIILRKIDE